MTLDVKNISARQRKLLDDQYLDNLGSNRPGAQPYTSQLERLADEFGKYLVKRTPEVLAKLDLKASGDLAQSGRFDMVLKGNEVVTLKFYLADHWINVHYGEKRSRSQGAKPPPIEEIKKWIAYKGIQVRKSREESLESVLETRDYLARKIQMSIWRRGYTVKRFGKKGSRFLDQVLDQESLDALAQMMGELGAVVTAFEIVDVVPRKMP